MAVRTNHPWLKDTVRGKLVNLTQRGKDIKVNVNGVSFIFADGATGDVPKAVVEAINDAVIWRYDTSKNLNLDKGETFPKIAVRPYEFFPEAAPKKEKVRAGKQPLDEDPEIATEQIKDEQADEVLSSMHEMRG